MVFTCPLCRSESCGLTVTGSKRRDKKNPGGICLKSAGYANTAICGMNIGNIMMSQGALFELRPGEGKP